MKKLYLLPLTALISSLSFGQLTVNAVAADPTICAGRSSNISATASPVGYTASAITCDPSVLYGMNYLADGGAQITPLSFGTLNDGRWDNIALPFTFNYFGTNYGSICVSTNGWIGLGSTNPTATGYNFVLPATNNPNSVIHAMTANLTFATATTSLEYFEDGSFPNRRFIVNFGNVAFVSAAGTANVQVMLYETSNIIEIHTSDCSNTSMNKAQGVENSTGTIATVATGRNNTASWSGMPNAYRFTPDNITYSWSPSTGLNTTTGPNVISTPSSTITYTVTATNTVNSQTGNANVTITVDPASYTLASVAGGPQVCQNITVGVGATDYRDGNCNLITTITPAGGSPVSNNINACNRLEMGSSKRGTVNTLFGPRQYDIEPQFNAPTATANVKLYYLQSEFDEFNTKAADSGHRFLPTGPADATGISNLMIRQFHGTGTNPLNYTGATQDFTTAFSGFTVVWNATRSWWEVNVPVTGFSGFYLTSIKTGSLALNLDYFKGVQIGKKHHLNWKVICTSAEARFEILRSGDGVDYTVIGNITASHLRCNDPFDFIDETPHKGTNFYRIKMIDVDGKTSLTNIVLLTLKTTRFDLLSLSPNPVTSGNAKLRISATEKNVMNITVTDFAGRVLQQQSVNIQAGLNEVPININKLSAGVYLVKAGMQGEKAQTLRLVKQ